jgi:membrane-bound lytic murein transglycosylase B
LRDFRPEALKQGISAQTYDRAVQGISLNAKVEALNLAQPEFVRPIWDYLAGAVSEQRVTRGRARLAVNAELFGRLNETYGVPPEILTAIWGIESAYGASQGGFNLFEALATLAFDGPRAAYGRREFLAALKIADQEKRDPATMTGSWAGAFGSTQFTPTTFLAHAVDGDGDGKRDLWNSPADALASTANDLKQSGWQPGASWGEEVQLPPNFPYELADFDIRKSDAEWAGLGVGLPGGAALPPGAAQASLFLPAGHRGPAFLVRDNFNVVLKYNFATSYALAVCLLADRLKGDAGIAGAWPRDEVPLDQTQRVALQQGLTALGYDSGGTDGVLGRRTRGALRDYQKARGLAADGFATLEVLARIQSESASPMPAMPPATPAPPTP